MDSTNSHAARMLAGYYVHRDYSLGVAVGGGGV